jgi:hypothetical protein
MQELGYTDEFGFRDSSDEDFGMSAPDAVPGVRRYWGKYPGVVMNPIDPEMRGRMVVEVPDVWGPNISSWAHPCLPWGGLSIGMFVVPPVGANVWVEFLHGHPDRPIWTGFWFGSLADPPPTSKLATPGVPQVVMESLLKHSIVISDSPIPGLLPLGGVLLRSGASFIAIEPTGVRIFGVPTTVNGDPTGNPASAALYIT